MSAYARRAIEQRQRLQQIKTLLASNSHTLIQMNSAEFIDYIISVKLKEGKSRAEVIDWLDSILIKHNCVSSLWEKIKEPLKTSSGLYPIFDDIKSLSILAAAMHKQGNVFGKFKVKVYNGSPAILISSYPRLHEHLTGTRYLASNPKLITIGVGKLEAAKAMKGGFVVSLIISVTFHATDQLLNDQKTWHDMVAGIAVDMAVVGAAIATSAAIIALGGTLVAGIAVFPLIIVVAVGILFSWFFSDTSSYVNFLSERLRISEENIRAGKIRVTNQIQKIENDYKDNPVDFLKKVFGIPTINKSPIR